MRRLLIATALLPLLLGSAADALAAGGSIKVSPTSGPNGTTFKISFLTPRAAPALGFRIALHTSGSHNGACVEALSFKSPPHAIGANVPLTVSVKPVAADELCTGAWTVSVASAAGAALLKGGHFKLT